MALTQVSTDGIKNGTITGSDLATNIDLVDNQKLRLGTGNDLKIYHNGSGSYIDDSSGTGELILKSNSISFTNAAENEYLARFFQDSAVQLYFNGSKKLETNASGVRVVGTLNTGNGATISFSDNVNLEDSTATQNNRIKLGAGDDLHIYHDGTDSLIKQTTGTRLKIQGVGSNGADVHIQARPDEEGIKLLNNSGESKVELYYDNSKKFETQSGGAKVSGLLTVDGNLISYSASNNSLGLTGHRWNDLFIANDIDISDNGKILLGNSDDLQIYHVGGANSYVQNFANNLYLSSTNSVQIVTTASDSSAQEISAKFFRNGAVELYNDNNKKFETTSQGIEVTSNGTVVASTVKSTGSARADMRILAEGTGEAYLWFDASNGDLSGADYAFIQHKNSTLDLLIGNYASDVIIKTRNGSLGSGGLNTSIHCHENGGVDLYHDTTKRLETTSNGIVVNGDIGSDGIYMGDNERAKFGASDDLQIYHDGTDSYILENGAGVLNIKTNGTAIDFTKTPHENLARFIVDGACELYHNNTKKFETASTGVRFPNNGTLSQNGMYFETGQNTNDYATMFGVTNYPDASGFSDQNDGHWAKIKSKGGCVVIINSDGGRNDGRNNYDHFSVYHKEGESSNGKRAFSVDHTGGVQCGQAGINIDREWGNQPSFSMTRDCNDGTNNTDDSAYFRFHGTARTHSSWTGGSNGADFSANMLLDGGNYNASDRRAKTDIVDCPYGLAEVLKLRPRKFQLVNSQLEPQGDDNINLGFIAQELMEILPEPVNYLKNEDVPNEKGFCRAYILDMNEVVPVLTKAIQELAAKVAVLESKT